MTDIVRRLRARAESFKGYPHGDEMREAADEIEQLRAALLKGCREDRAEFLGGCFHANMAQAEIKVAADEIERLRADIIAQMQERGKAADEIEMLRDEIKRLCRIPVRSADEHINTVIERNIRKAMQEPDPEGTP